MKHLGVLAHSTGGAALCFLTFCEEGFRRTGRNEHPDVTLDYIAFGYSMPAWDAGDHAALDHGYHVVLEGILHTGRHRSMLTGLRDGHRGRSLFCYLDVSLPETLRRHLTRPQAGEFTAEQMSGWYAARDVLGWPGELVLPETTTLYGAVGLIAAAAGLPQTGGDHDVRPLVS
ncbi:hypothetical protein ACWENR_29260 [Micromonospora sp. NPDC004336]